MSGHLGRNSGTMRTWQGTMRTTQGNMRTWQGTVRTTYVHRETRRTHDRHETQTLLSTYKDKLSAGYCEPIMFCRGKQRPVICMPYMYALYVCLICTYHVLEANRGQFEGPQVSRSHLQTKRKKNQNTKYTVLRQVCCRLFWITRKICCQSICCQSICCQSICCQSICCRLFWTAKSMGSQLNEWCCLFWAPLVQL